MTTTIALLGLPSQPQPITPHVDAQPLFGGKVAHEDCSQ
jgi:hypothetical protein